MFRIAYPALAKEAIATGLPNGINLVVVADGRVHMLVTHQELKIDRSTAVAKTERNVTHRWWTANADGKNVRLTADNMPEIQAIGVS